MLHSFTSISHMLHAHSTLFSANFRHSHMDVMVLQYGQLFHHEEAHQQKPDAMNFRHMLCNHGNHAKPIQ